MEFRLYHNCWIPANSPHRCEEIHREDAFNILRQGGVMLRNTFNWDKKEPTSFWYIIKDRYEEIELLPTKIRYKVRKSQRCYDYRMISPSEMYEKCFNLYNESRIRFGGATLSKEQWYQRIMTADNNYQYWVCFEKDTGSPVAFSINQIYEDYCSYVSLGFSPKAPTSSYPMYGLIMAMNHYYLEKCKLRYVLDGARSITEHSNVQPFLEETFGFRKAYCDLQLFYKSWLSICISALYPFRKLFFKSNFKSLIAMLRQEAMARNEY